MKNISIIPQPVKIELTGGEFLFTPETSIVAAGDAAGVAAYLAEVLQPALGHKSVISPAAAKPDQPVIHLSIDSELSRLGKEGYLLSINPQQVDIKAPAPAGLFYGVQTLRQLLPPEIFADKPAETITWSVPCLEIEDYPRFGWRGAMLDVCRHFMPLEFIYKFIDLLALHKMNSFHWHLTEDQGWRIEIKKYPKLTEVGAWRRETMVGRLEWGQTEFKFDGIPHGGFYSQDQIRQVVDYAKSRFINVLPEIEMPGHSQAAIASYPELGNTGKQIEVSCGWGIHEDVFNVEESTILFLQDVLTEVMELFPSTFIHVGGDECPKTHWKNSPAAQKRMKDLGLKDEDELQSYFIRRMDTFLTAHGRRLVGWDEILEGGLAPGATVMSWRGEEGGITAANADHDVVMAPTQYTYLDYYQSQDTDKEPLAIGGFLPLERVYQYDPVPQGIQPDKVKHVLGTQAQLWTEYMPNPAHVEYMAFPRLSALSEVAWTPLDRKDYSQFIQRLRAHLSRLDALKVNYRKLD